MSQNSWPKPRALAAAVLLTAALVAAACASRPEPPSVPASQPKQGGTPAPEPRKGLTFRYHGAGDGMNTNGPTPSTSWTEFDASDGSELRAYQYSFKRPEYAEKFYAEKVAEAAAVLREEVRAAGPDFVGGRRAVVEYAGRGGGRRGAVLELRGSSVSEVIGATVGHALAYEEWREGQRQ
jgi:hypothetical protein